jgi:hypothetical protein
MYGWLKQPASKSAPPASQSRTGRTTKRGNILDPSVMYDRVAKQGDEWPVGTGNAGAQHAAEADDRGPAAMDLRDADPFSIEGTVTGAMTGVREGFVNLRHVWDMRDLKDDIVEMKVGYQSASESRAVYFPPPPPIPLLLLSPHQTTGQTTCH